MTRSKKLMRLALLPAILVLAGCETLTPGLMSGASSSSLKSPPATEAGARRAYPACHYTNYCEAQKCIAEFHSRRDGKVYKAPCDLDAPAPKPADKKPPAKPDPTTAGWQARVRDEPKPI